ncbi:MAG: tetratricopeptide repeat protein [Verrucomicrobiae bacterium]|nr:tetratricopeptide repeat protein [Verrucomicrobiae bacterium]
MPEKQIHEIPRTLREQYEKARAAFERNNLDYAISILTSVLEREPAFFDARQLLRASQFKKVGQKSGSFLSKIVGSANPKLVQAQVAMRSQPLHALNLVEHVLNGDPNNVTAHKVLAEAAWAADLPRTAVLSLEIAYKHSPKDREVAMLLAQGLTKIGQPARAEKVLEELASVYPDDPEIAQALKDVAASRTLTEGGYEALAQGGGSYRDVLRDEREAVVLEQEKREIKTEDVADRLIAEYEERLAAEPQDLRLIRSIAELYVQKKDYDRALEYYERLVKLEGADPAVERAMAEVRVRKIDDMISRLDPSEPDYKEKVAKLKAEREAFLLEDAKRRVERYPSDLQLRFELGRLYFEAGRLNEAIQEFQKAQNNPHKRIQALYYLGQCFARKNMYDLAARTFQNAIKEKVVFDDEKKDLVYALGCALEKMGRSEEAIEQFKLIYEIDISYRDVAEKVDRYYARRAIQGTDAASGRNV